jgi:glycerophosphoryl diester phosphodiesterase
VTTPAPALPIAAQVRVIAHRGASAWRPEHTLASYAKAIADGADFIEPDLVMTRDGVPVARHGNEIGSTTDVADHRAFASRRTRKRIDGDLVEGWFVEDFTLAELKRLRARERLPPLRGSRYDGMFAIPTLEEIIDFLAAQADVQGRTIGLMPELKHGSYSRGLGLPMEDRVLGILAAHRYTRHAPVELQSFEIGNLLYLRRQLGPERANVSLLQLIDDDHPQPADVLAAHGTLTYAQMLTPAGLHRIATYADAIAPPTRMIIPLGADGRLAHPTTLVRDAHEAGLQVQPYTFRPENIFIAADFHDGGAPEACNEAGSIAEIRAYLDTGIDGFFTDDPALGRKALALR